MLQVIVVRKDGTTYLLYETDRRYLAKEVAAESRLVSTTARVIIRRKRPWE